MLTKYLQGFQEAHTEIVSGKQSPVCCLQDTVNINLFQGYAKPRYSNRAVSKILK